MRDTGRVYSPQPCSPQRASNIVPPVSRRSFWHVTVREATAHAVILAAVLWIGAALLLVSGREEQQSRRAAAPAYAIGL